MSRYVLLATLNPEGRRAVGRRPGHLEDVNDALAAVGVRVLEQYAMSGQWDFLSLVEASDNVTMAAAELSVGARGAAKFVSLPATDIPTFVKLLQTDFGTTGPHPWQTQWWARAVRRVNRYRTHTQWVRKFAQPFTVTGQESLAGVGGPVVFVGNHASLFDGPVLMTALPRRFKGRTVIGAAADRFYQRGQTKKGRKGWYNSLYTPAFPVLRSGGRASLAYAGDLLRKGWSIALFPEGTRSTSGKLLKFRPGATILALENNVPVVPVYMEGLAQIRPKGSRELTAGPASARFGTPVHLPPGTSIGEGTHLLELAMHELATSAPS